ncbi:MAG: MATE family efflux transporter [Oscillospiraceae bacterium]|nr:MATE family efflux transporter [Oscillospiraceae bacterium]
MAGIPFARKKSAADMTRGSIALHLISFAFPLLLGNIFQQLYNTVDTWVVGNFASNEAFSAVGSVGPIINVLIGLFMGLSTGAGAVISQFYGARHLDRVRDTVHTAILMTAILSVVFTLVGLLFTPAMLRLMKMPANVMPEAITYLRIYFAGVTGLLFYNMGSAILRAVGDSTRPFYFLVVAALLNSALDLLFVVKLRMGVAGVAWATIIAQGVSASLVVRSLLRSQDAIRLELRRLKFHWDVLKKIFKVGIPAALQLAVTSFSNVFVQSYINYFGDNFMSGWTAFSKINQIVILPMQSLSLAITTFVGQNLGAGLGGRAKKSVGVAFCLSAGTAAVLMVPMMFFAPHLVAFFNPKPEVIRFGTQLLRIISPFYLVYCVHDTLGGALRGAGNGKVPMICTLVCLVGFRQLYLYVMAHFICNDVIPIAMSFPAGWLLSSTLVLIYFSRTKMTDTRLVDA